MFPDCRQKRIDLNTERKQTQKDKQRHAHVFQRSFGKFQVLGSLYCTCGIAFARMGLCCSETKEKTLGMLTHWKQVSLCTTSFARESLLSFQLNYEMALLKTTCPKVGTCA